MFTASSAGEHGCWYRIHGHQRQHSPRLKRTASRHRYLSSGVTDFPSFAGQEDGSRHGFFAIGVIRHHPPGQTQRFGGLGQGKPVPKAPLQKAACVLMAHRRQRLEPKRLGAQFSTGRPFDAVSPLADTNTREFLVIFERPKSPFADMPLTSISARVPSDHLSRSFAGNFAFTAVIVLVLSAALTRSTPAIWPTPTPDFRAPMRASLSQREPAQCL